MHNNFRMQSRVIVSILYSTCIFSLVIPTYPAQAGNSSNSEKFYTIIPRDAEPCLIIDSDSEPGVMLSEGPTWFQGRFYFSNIHYPDKRGSEGLHVMNPDGTYTVLNKDIQSEGIKPLFDGNLAVCDLKSRSIIEVSPEGKVIKTLADSCDGSPLGPPNDIIVDNKGGFYVTLTFPGNQPGTTVYYCKPNGKVIRVAEWNEFKAPNGCLLSADYKRFYLTDSRDTTVWMFDVNEDGTLSKKRPFATMKLAEGKDKSSSGADGMTMDTAGNIYCVSLIGIQVFDKNGDFLGCIPIPERPTHCTFGGTDLSILYVTCFVDLYTIQTKTKGYQYPIR